MVDRRDFIKTGVAASAGIMLTEGLRLHRTTPAPCSIGIALYDPRFPESVAFASALMAAGAEVISNDTDIGHLWHGALGTAFATSGGALAGMTPHSDLFVSQVIARERHRSRLAYEGLHDNRGNSGVTHSLSLPPPGRGLAATVAAAGDSWPTLLATRLSQLAFGPGRLERETARNGTAANGLPGTIFSWVIVKSAS